MQISFAIKMELFSPSGRLKRITVHTEKLCTTEYAHKEKDHCKEVLEQWREENSSVEFHGQVTVIDDI